MYKTTAFQSKLLVKASMGQLPTAKAPTSLLPYQGLLGGCIILLVQTKSGEHHLRCKKPIVNRGIHYLLNGSQDFFHQRSHKWVAESLDVYHPLGFPTCPSHLVVDHKGHQKARCPDPPKFLCLIHFMWHTSQWVQVKSSPRNQRVLLSQLKRKLEFEDCFIRNLDLTHVEFIPRFYSTIVPLKIRFVKNKHRLTLA